MENVYQRKFKTRESICPILKEIFIKKKINFYITKENELIYINTNISGMEFRRIVEEAMCIEQQGDSDVPVFSYHILKNKRNREGILKQYGRTGFNVLAKDRDRVKNLF